jgi:DNA-binding CsgD family transcriptional regulator
MQHAGKTLSIDQHGRSVRSAFVAGPGGACSVDNSLTAPAAPSDANLWFARYLVRLLACDRCYVAVLSPTLERLDEVRLGCPASDLVSESNTLSIAIQFCPQASHIYQSATSMNGFARRLIGNENTLCHHSVIGCVQSQSGSIAKFVAGWRRMPLSTPEFVCVAHAIDLMWDAAADLARMQLQQRELWFNAIVPPALVVDKDLVVRHMNSSFRQLLGQEVLMLERGAICGATSAITSSLKEAVHASIGSAGKPAVGTSTVLLSSDGQRFSFAVIGAPPGDIDSDLALILVPRFDEIGGARRIAVAFNLSWVEERIVCRILRGRCPRLIGTELGFTEETVRTYIKRIMLKIGINRQSELFVLHALTLSPFQLRQPEHHFSVVPDGRQTDA